MHLWIPAHWSLETVRMFIHTSHHTYIFMDLLFGRCPSIPKVAKGRHLRKFPGQKPTLPETNKRARTCQAAPGPKRKRESLPVIHFQVSVSGWLVVEPIHLTSKWVHLSPFSGWKFSSIWVATTQQVTPKTQPSSTSPSCPSRFPPLPFETPPDSSQKALPDGIPPDVSGYSSNPLTHRFKQL